MKKLYEEPELIVRNYRLSPSSTVTTSDPSNGSEEGDNSLNDDDEYDIFG